MTRLRLYLTATALFIPLGCVQHSPNAKVSTVINVSLTSPTTIPL
jgi:hypothetical protein